MSLAELEAAGLVTVGAGCTISPHALFRPTDLQGASRPITLGDGCVVGDAAILHGGTQLAPGAWVEAHAIIGTPEHGYALGRTHPGTGAATHIGAGAVIRAGAILYAGVSVDQHTTIGHGTLLRSHVTVGADTQLGHYLTIERAAHIGSRVRCSPLSHLTSAIRIEDDAFLGARIATINDKTMLWRQPDHTPRLAPPVIATHAKVGSGAILAAGVRIGRHAMVGAGALVTRDVADGALVSGIPARPHTCRHDHPPLPTPRS